jgi:hypothetical protein
LGGTSSAEGVRSSERKRNFFFGVFTTSAAAGHSSQMMSRPLLVTERTRWRMSKYCFIQKPFNLPYSIRGASDDGEKGPSLSVFESAFVSAFEKTANKEKRRRLVTTAIYAIIEIFEKIFLFTYYTLLDFLP